MAKKGKQFPVKTTINLAMRERDPNRPSKVVPLVLIVLTIAVIFGKFAVADRFTRINDMREILQAQQQRVEELEGEAAMYKTVSTQYAKYASGWMTDEERALFDRMDAVALVEEQLTSVGQIERFSVVQNVLAVDLSGVTLGATSELVSRLESLDDIVASVEVYTANNQLSGGVANSISMTITLQNEESIRQKSAPDAEGGATE